MSTAITRLSYRASFSDSPSEWKKPRVSQQMTWEGRMKKCIENLGMVGVVSSSLGSKRSIGQLAGDTEGYSNELRAVAIVLLLPVESEQLKN